MILTCIFPASALHYLRWTKQLFECIFRRLRLHQQSSSTRFTFILDVSTHPRHLISVMYLLVFSKTLHWKSQALLQRYFTNACRMVTSLLNGSVLQYMRFLRLLMLLDLISFAPCRVRLFELGCLNAFLLTG